LFSQLLYHVRRTSLRPAYQGPAQGPPEANSVPPRRVRGAEEGGYSQSQPRGERNLKVCSGRSFSFLQIQQLFADNGYDTMGVENQFFLTDNKSELENFQAIDSDAPYMVVYFVNTTKVDQRSPVCVCSANHRYSGLEYNYGDILGTSSVISHIFQGLELTTGRNLTDVYKSICKWPGIQTILAVG
jgi:hypothetical protein